MVVDAIDVDVDGGEDKEAKERRMQSCGASII